MLVSDVLRVKGHNVVKILATDSVELAVRRLAEHRIGAIYPSNYLRRRSIQRKAKILRST